MRMDKLTSRFQQALSDAQSLAVGRDHNLIEPAHLLLALLDQQGGSTRPLLAPGRRQRADAARSGWSRPSTSCRRWPGRRAMSVSATTWRACSTSPTSWRSSAAMPFIASELFVLAALDDKGAGRAGAEGRRRAQGEAGKSASKRCAAARRCRTRTPRKSARRWRNTCIDLTERAESGKLDPGDRPRRGNPPHHPGAAAPHQEQSGADRRARRGQDRDRRRPGAAHRQWRSARRPKRNGACCRWTWAR